MSDEDPPPLPPDARAAERGEAAPARAAPRESPESRPDALYVVSDGAGFVGAFPSAAAAEEAMRPHPLEAYIVQRFAAAPGPVDTVWVVLYRDIDAVAFVSNDRSEAARVQQVYAGVGLAYPDDVDYWEQPFGAVTKPAAERLELQTRAYQSRGAATDADLLAAEEADAARVEALCAPRAGGPLDRALRENKRITILDAVVPWSPGRGAENCEGGALACGPRAGQ